MGSLIQMTFFKRREINQQKSKDESETEQVIPTNHQSSSPIRKRNISKSRHSLQPIAFYRKDSLTTLNQFKVTWSDPSLPDSVLADTVINKTLQDINDKTSSEYDSETDSEYSYDANDRRQLLNITDQEAHIQSRDGSCISIALNERIDQLYNILNDPVSIFLMVIIALGLLLFLFILTAGFLCGLSIFPFIDTEFCVNFN